MSQSQSGGGQHGTTLTMSRSPELVNSDMLCLLVTRISELRWEKYQRARVLRDSRYSFRIKRNILWDSSTTFSSSWAWSASP